MKWYVVRVQGNREKSVSEKLKKHSIDGELMGKVGEVIAPVEKSFLMKDGKKIKREKPLYPGYVFIQTNSVGELKSFFKNITGISGFLSDRQGEPQSLSETEVVKMIGNYKEEIAKEAPFVVGEEVSILDGPFSTFKGTINRISDGKVTIDVSIFGRVTPVDLNVMQIIKA